MSLVSLSKDILQVHLWNCI